MPKFIIKPTYEHRDIAAMLNGYEQGLVDRHGACVCAGRGHPVGAVCTGCSKYRPKQWNRKNVRTFLRNKYGVVDGDRPGAKKFFTFTELKELAPDLVDSMVLIDKYEDILNAA